jgi:Asp-tRNA(Asn)/Glu-tRNA(Gln) amidotransferase C subunit
MQDVDTTGIQPLDTLLEDAPLELRDDVAVRRASVEGMLRNAPESFEGFFVASKEDHFEQQHGLDGDGDGGGDSHAR